MKREGIRLGRRHRAWVYASVAALVATGVPWLVAQTWLGDGAAFGESASALVPWSLRLHGAAAMIALIVLGTLLPGHVQRAWASGKSRRTGALVLGSNALLIATGYGLYYVGAEGLRAIASPLHWGVGLALPGVLAWHVWEGRRLRRRRRGRPGRRRAAPARPAPAAGDAAPEPGRQIH